MKFRLLSFLFILSLYSFGQENFTRSKYFGLEIGPNFSTFFNNSIQISGGSKTSVSGKNGFLVGISNEYIIKPRISFKYGFLLERKGGVLTHTYGSLYNSIVSKDTVKLNYLVIPLLFSVNNLTGFYCNVGPYVGFLPQTSSTFKKFDLGGVFGIGIRFKTTKNNLFEIGIKESLGLINVSAIDLTNYRNNSLSLNVALKFKSW